MDSTPAGPPSSGLQTYALFITFCFPSLALLVTITRVAGRVSARMFALDDVLICIAMFLSIIETIASYFFIKTNFIGIRGVDIPQSFDEVEARIWNYAVQPLYNVVLALVKCSLLIFLLRLLGKRAGVRRFIIILNTVNLLHMAGAFFSIVFQCYPIQKNWDPTVKGICLDSSILFMSTTAFSIVTDILVLGLPVYIFKGLNIPLKAKIALLFVFLLGALVTVTSVARLFLLAEGIFRFVVSDDPTYNISFTTSAIEINLALITASVPALMPLLRKWFPSLVGEVAGDTSPDLKDTEKGTPRNKPTRSTVLTTKSSKSRESEEAPYKDIGY